jgi:hypothetical protein
MATARFLSKSTRIWWRQVTSGTSKLASKATSTQTGGNMPPFVFFPHALPLKQKGGTHNVQFRLRLSERANVNFLVNPPAAIPVEPAPAVPSPVVAIISAVVVIPAVAIAVVEPPVIAIMVSVRSAVSVSITASVSIMASVSIVVPVSVAVSVAVRHILLQDLR